MWDKFGEFNSATEINEAAAGQKEQGDKEALLILAKENGIDKEDVEDYMDGVMPFLCTVVTAALGKLKVEAADVKLIGIELDWYEYIKQLAMEEPKIGENIRKKDKSLIGCMGKLFKWGADNMQPVDNRIVEAAHIAGLKNAKEGTPDMATAKDIIRKYYA